MIIEQIKKYGKSQSAVVPVELSDQRILIEDIFATSTLERIFLLEMVDRFSRSDLSQNRPQVVSILNSRKRSTRVVWRSNKEPIQNRYGDILAVDNLYSVQPLLGKFRQAMQISFKQKLLCGRWAF